MFFGLGADGTVGANKNTIKILGADRGLNAQGYFVYDSKKSGSQTVSHLRFGPDPIQAPYLILAASFVGCHQAELLERADVLGVAAPGATLLLNTPRPAADVWDSLPRPVQEQILGQADHRLRDRRHRGGPRGAARADQHGAADLLLRHFRRPAPGRGDRGHQGGHRQDLRPARR